ncbi:hypothetical protein [Shewanella woodyi]
MSLIIGIGLGSTNSLVSYWGGEADSKNAMPMSHLLTPHSGQLF